MSSVYTLRQTATAHWETEEANTVFTKMLTAYPEIQRVIGASGSMAVGIVKAMEAGNRKDIQVIGFDNIPVVGPMIADGRMLATVDQFGQAMAANAVDRALAVLKGSPKLGGWVKTDIKLVTK